MLGYERNRVGMVVMMRGCSLFGLFGLVMCAQASAQSGPIPGASQGTLHAKLVEVIDSTGFGQPLVAFSILVPADWRPEGGVVWSGTADPCGGMGYNFHWQATSPDGRSGVAIVPTANWQFSTTGMAGSTGCPPQQIASVGDYLQAVAQQYRPGAQILDFRPRPDLAQQFQHLNSSTPMPLGEMRSWVESGEVLIGYPAEGGEMRETIAGTVVLNVMRTEAMSGMPASEYWSGGSMPGFAVRAPAGQLDFQFAEAMRKSIRSGPEWSQRIAQHHARMNGIALKGSKERAAINRQHYEDMSRIRQESWQSWNESSDRMHRETVETIRGVETYDDPYNGGTVELDNTYENAWQLNDGSYVLTDDPSFEPYAVFGQDGQRLQPTE